MNQKNIFKKIFCPILAVFLMFQTTLPALAYDFPRDWPQAPDIKNETGVLMEVSTGQILFDKDMDEIRYPASTTKVMTALLILELVEDLNAKVTFTDVITPDLVPGNSTINARVGEELTVEQCLYAILLASANEVCTQMAVYTTGSVETFTEMMNQRAAELGCKNTHFVNANGLPDPNHYSTAHDLALILAEAVKNPAFCKVAGAAKYTIPATNKTPYDRNLENSNKLLTEGDFHYDKAIAGKTGHTEAAKNTLVTAAAWEDMTLVCVVMRSDGTDRFTDTTELFNYGFNNFHKEPVFWLDEEPAGYVILPKEVKAGSLSVLDKDENNIRTRSFSYQGQVFLQASKELPIQTDTKISSDMAMFQTGIQTVNLSFPLLFPVLTAVLALFCIALVFVIIKHVLTQKRKKKRKKKPVKKV